MRNKMIVTVFFGIQFLCSAQEKTTTQLNINWGKYLSQHDLMWDKVPKDYFEGVFVVMAYSE
jgi:hypothetical protein